MQTSSNFFNKSLFTIDEDHSLNRKKLDRYHQNHILQDPLRQKQQLTPWTQINPKYNFNTERLIKFKQKNIQQVKHQLQDDQQTQPKQIKSQMISNLFNFYKNNKEKKRSTLNNAKRKSKPKNQPQQTDNAFTLPSIFDKQQLQQDLIQNKNIQKQEEQKQQQKPNNQNNNKKPKGSNYIQSMSIREYLMKLKDRQKVFASSPLSQKYKDTNPTQQFTSQRHVSKNKGNMSHSISVIKQLPHSDPNFRYGSMRNPQNSVYKKRQNFSQLQSLQQSFQIYKKAAQQQVSQALGVKKVVDKYHKSLNTSAFIDKQHWKNNVPLGALFSSPNLQSSKSNNNSIQKSQIKKYNTISYDRSFSPTNNTIQLPKINKNFSYNQ